ncbi:hypothetical protein [Pseudomonas sp.]|jgi:uncharacterized protein YoxC|uniref:hypothetical protein n=1 Tax=Pseudomonas sp. TaxID=306 RepID=UPI00272956B1|nr:hypothetical protein [Pseudomonas sp.]
MRDRDFDDLSGIRATDDERPYAGASGSDTALAGVRATPRVAPATRGNAMLWAVCGALVLAVVGLGYWSHQEQTRLQQQLVATQASFARISEQAATRLEDITGKVSATESSLSEVEQFTRTVDGLNQRLRELAQRVNDQSLVIQTMEQGRERLAANDQTQLANLESLSARTAELAGRVEAFDSHADATIAQLAGMQTRLDSIEGRLAALDELSSRLAAQGQQLAEQQKRVEQLSKRLEGNELQRELVAVRGELDQRLASTEQELRAIDSFRIQTNRTLSALQTQMRTLQQSSAP